MDVEWVQVVFRVAHVATAIVLVGGSVFMRFAVMPAESEMSESDRANFRGRVLRSWGKFVHGGITVLLASGFYNYLAVTRPLHKGDGHYHMLVGIKILLAMVLFFLASALVGRSARLKGLRERARTTVTVMLILAAAIVSISGYLKIRGEPIPAVSTAVGTGLTAG